MSDDLAVTASDIVALEQAEGPFRRLAAMLGLLREKLIDEGFTEEGAEHQTAIFATAVLKGPPFK